MNTKDEIYSLLQKLPNKLQVCFALACAEDVFQYVRDEDRAVIRSCLDTVKLWLEDKATAEELNATYNAAYNAANAISNTAASNAAYAAYNAAYNATSNAAHTAYYAANAARTANAASNAARTAYYAADATYNAASNAAKASNKDLGYYLDILKTMIKDLSRLEILLYDLNQEEV